MQLCPPDLSKLMIIVHQQQVDWQVLYMLRNGHLGLNGDELFDIILYECLVVVQIHKFGFDAEEAVLQPVNLSHSILNIFNYELLLLCHFSLTFSYYFKLGYMTQHTLLRLIHFDKSRVHLTNLILVFPNEIMHSYNLRLDFIRFLLLEHVHVLNQFLDLQIVLSHF